MRIPAFAPVRWVAKANNDIYRLARNVGIGTSTPDDFKLQVAGDIGPDADLGGNLGSAAKRYDSVFAGPSSYHLVSTLAETSTARDWQLGIRTTGGLGQGNFHILEGASAFLDLTPAGNVGVGTIDPQAKLHVDGNIIAAAPTDDAHVTTKGYVDSVVQGISWQDPVLSKVISDPSLLTPAEGDRYIVAAGAVGEWVGKEKQIAEYETAAWVFFEPEEGWAIWVEDEDILYTYNADFPAGTWVKFSSTVNHSALANLDVQGDHPSYVTLDGTRAMTGSLTVNPGQVHLGVAVSDAMLKRVGSSLQIRRSDDTANIPLLASQVGVDDIGNFQWTTRTQIRSPDNGDLLFQNAAQDDFGLLKFGGVSSGYPALKRSGAILEVRDAADTGYGSARAQNWMLPTDGLVSWDTLSDISSPDNGSILLTNDAGDDFTLLQFGGITGSFPAIRKVSTGLQVRSADNLGFLDLYARNLYASALIQAGQTSQIRWATSSQMFADANGSIRLTDNVGDDFGMLQFGGTSNLYPALKRDSAKLHVKLADDSAFADLLINNLYAAGSARVGGAYKVYWDGASQITAPEDGNLLLRDSGSTGFSLLQFGGTTSSFPALKRDGVGLRARLADDSADTTFQAASLIVGDDAWITDDATNGLKLSDTGSNYRLYVHTNRVQVTSDIPFGWFSSTAMDDDGVNGNLRLSNYAQNDFGLLKFGGLTDEFPALKRSTDELHVRLADDSDFANLRAATVTAATLSVTAVADHLNPSADITYDLGENTTPLRWRAGYFGPGSLHVSSTAAETTTARDYNFHIEETASTEEGNFRLREGTTDLVSVTPAGNVGIGADDPTQKLAVAGNFAFDAADRSIYRGAVERVALTSTATQFKAVKTLFDNNVGIGVDPATRLHVKQDQTAATLIRVENATTDVAASAGLDIVADASAVSVLAHSSTATGTLGGQAIADSVGVVAIGAAPSKMLIGNVAAVPIHFITENLLALTISGTTQALLGVDGSNADPTYSFIGAQDMGTYRSGTSLAFAVGGAQQFSISTGQLVGNVSGSAGLRNTTSSTTVPSLLPYRNVTTSGIGGDVSGNVFFITGSTEAMRVNASQQVLVGTSAVGSGSLLTINGTVSASDPTADSHLTTKQYVQGLIEGLDWQQSVLDKDVTDPSTLTPSTGDRYIVAAGAVGAWVGQDEKISEYNGAGWDFTTPNRGFSVYVEDEQSQYMYTGGDWPAGAWSLFTSVAVHSGLGGLVAPADDHTQYVHVDGRRGLTGNLNPATDGGANLGTAALRWGSLDSGPITLKSSGVGAAGGFQVVSTGSANVAAWLYESAAGVGQLQLGSAGSPTAQIAAAADSYVPNAFKVGALAGSAQSGQFQWTGSDMQVYTGSVWESVVGAGDVTKVGTPADNQLGVWTGDGTIEGTSGLTFDGTTLSVQKIVLSDALRLAGTTDTTAGNVRWDGSNFQGYTGSAWTNLDTQGQDPGGATTQVQFNDAGSFAGDSSFVWDNTNKWLGIGAVPTRELTVTANRDATSGLSITNSNSGTAAGSQINITSDSATSYWAAYSSTKTGAIMGLDLADSILLSTSSTTPPARMMIGTKTAIPLHLFTNSNGAAAPALTIDTSQDVQFSNAIRLGTTTNVTAGNVRWDGSNFQGYTGSAWTNLDTQGASVAGADTQLQFNDSGDLGASASLTWDGSTLGVNNVTLAGNLLGDSAAGSIVVAGGNAWNNGARFTMYGGSAGAQSNQFNLSAAEYNFNAADGVTNQMKIDSNGHVILSDALRLAGTTDTTAGNVRWDGSNFQGYTGSAWTNLDTQGAPGDVTKVGTPVNNQLGVWTGDGTIEGTSGLTFDGSWLNVNASQAGALVSQTISNSNAAADSNARLAVSSTGGNAHVTLITQAGGGDPTLLLTAGGDNYYMALDNTDDTLKWGYGTTVGSSLGMSMTAGTNPDVLFANGIRLGTTSNTTAGNVQWNGSNFQGYTGSAWVDLDTQGGLPGGADTNIQYNSSGSFAGDAGFAWTGSQLQVLGSGFNAFINNQTASTSGVFTTLTLRAESSGTLNGQFGPQIAFSTDDVATGPYTHGSLRCLTDVAFPDNSRFEFYNRSGTAFVRALTVLPGGALQLRHDTNSTNVPVGFAELVAKSDDHLWYRDESDVNYRLNTPPVGSSGTGGYIQMYSGADNAAPIYDSLFLFNSATNRLGVGNASPQESLHLAGAAVFGSASNTNAGTVEWSGSNFRGYTGSAWVNLDTQGTTPGGATTQVQINDGGSFYGDANFTYTKATGYLYLNGEMTVAKDQASITSLKVNNVSTSAGAIAELAAQSDSAKIQILAYGSNVGGSDLFGQDTDGAIAIRDPVGTEATRMLIGTAGSAPIVFGTKSLCAMTIDDSQNVGIGDFSATTVDRAIHVLRDESAPTSIGVINENSGTAASSAFVAESDTARIGLHAFSSTYSGSALGELRADAVFITDSTAKRCSQMVIGTGAAVPIKFATAGVTRLTVDGAGNVGIGITPSQTLHLARAGAGTAADNHLYIDCYSEDTYPTMNGAMLVFRKSDSNTVANAATDSGDLFGSLRWQGSTVSGWTQSADIRVFQSAANSGAFSPSYMAIRTATTGGAMAEAMRIDSSQRVILTDGLQLANTTNATAGNVRWNASNFQGYTGSAWVNLDTQGGTPGGADTQLQFNDSGAFGADSNLAWNNTDKRLLVGTAAASSNTGSAHIVNTVAVERAEDSTSAANFSTRRARGSFGSETTLVDGDLIGRLVFQGFRETRGYGGYGSNSEAIIQIEAAGSWTATSSPTKMTWHLMPTGAGAINAEVLSLWPGGELGVGDFSVKPQQKFEVLGAIKLGSTSLDVNGSIRYTGSDFEGRKAGVWTSMTAQGTVTGPAGSDTWIQFNDSGVFGASEDFRANADGSLSIGGSIYANSGAAVTNIYSFAYGSDPRANFIGQGTGGTKASPTNIGLGDAMALFIGNGWGGGGGRPGAQIEARVATTGTISASSMPGNLVFKTSADGSILPTERMRIDEDGNVGIGTASPGERLSVVKLADYGWQSISTYSTDANEYTILDLRKSRNNAETRTVTQTGEIISRIRFQGVNNTTADWTNAAEIRVVQNGASAATSVPSDMVFFIGAGGVSGVPEAFRIKSDKRLILQEGLQLADSAFSTSGNIKFDGSNFKGYTGSAWVNLDTQGGTGDVTKVGTPVNNQLGVWTGDGTLEGTSELVYDAAAGRLTLEKDQAGSSSIFVNNYTTTDGAASSLVLVTDNGQLNIVNYAPNESGTLYGVTLADASSISAAAGALFLNTSGSDNMYLGTANTLAMTIGSNQHVGIGMAASDYYGLAVQGAEGLVVVNDPASASAPMARVSVQSFSGGAVTPESRYDLWGSRGTAAAQVTLATNDVIGMLRWNARTPTAWSYTDIVAEVDAAPTGDEAASRLVFKTCKAGAGVTTAVEAMRIDSSQRVGIGATVLAGTLHTLRAGATTSNDHYFDTYSTSDTYGSTLTLRKVGSDTPVHGVTVDDEFLGALVWAGNTGSQFGDAAAISVEQDGSAGGTRIPGRIHFLTSPGGTTDPVEAMRIDSSQRVGIGTTPTARFHAYESTVLGSTSMDTQLLTRVEGNAGTTNKVHRDLYLRRDAAGSDWNTARLHDSIGIDSSYVTPRVNTRTWYERDPFNQIHEWGSGSSSYMTLSANNLTLAVSYLYCNVFGRGTTNGSMYLTGGNSVSNGANIELYGSTHATLANVAYYDAATHTFRNVAGSTTSLHIDSTGNVKIPGQIFQGAITEYTPTGTTQTVDWDNGNVQEIDLESATGNVTLTLSNPEIGATYIIRVRQDSTTPRNIVWPGTVYWPGGTAPTISTGADAVDKITLLWDGSNYFGDFGQDYQ